MTVDELRATEARLEGEIRERQTALVAIRAEIVKAEDEFSRRRTQAFDVKKQNAGQSNGV